TGGNATVPTAQRRIGSAWAAFEAAERTLGPDDDAALWTSVSTVYPELQDWVARRGHGGAALWETAKSTAAIAALRSGVDILIVDLHSGFQYAEVPSERLRQAAYDAIDAGADLVVGLHPHVLQGAEWYRGKLIVWSLGNFIFDQSFLVTFPSAFLRTVWEDGRLIQARLIPMMLEDYKPVPVVDGAARNILRAVWDSGLSGAAAARGDDLNVRAILPNASKEGAQPAAFQFKNHAIEIRTEFSEPEERSILFTSPDPVRLDVDGLVWSPLDIEPPWDVALGRSQFGWGGFENVDVDDESVEGSHWALEPSLDKGVVDNHAWRGRCSLRMHRKFTAAQELIARPVARIPLTQHRFWRDGQTAADGLPLFSIHAAVQAAGDCDRGMFRLDYYYFNDTDPTVAPESALIRSVEYPIEAPADWRWHEVWIDIPPEDLAPDEQGRPIVSVLLYVVMKPSCFFDTTMWFDDVDLVAWRNAVDQPPLWGAWDWVRCYRRSATEITVRTLPW
ncbi:MAG: hypothetical protein QG656_314, partial [Candidatus Hydrogenedentes bacterium]|nr:hypothetical protein [Candidatus Hydrogenedentota bacterium]